MHIKTEPVMAWHFVGDTLRDGRPVPADGVWLRHEGKCEICRAGLHASRRLLDAINFAREPMLCRVECMEIEDEQPDKLVCRARRIVARFDATDLLRKASRKFALDVAHLWDAPDVVLQFLRSGDESLEDVVRDAAWGAARDAAWGATEDAAQAAARAAACASGWSAWREPVTALDAVQNTAWDAASAAQSAMGAERDAAQNAAWKAALAAVQSAQNDWVTQRALEIIAAQMCVGQATGV